MSFFKKPKKEGEDMQYPSDSAEILSQLKRITDQLSFLEKKIDSLMGRPGGSGRPGFGNRPGGFGNRPPRQGAQGYSPRPQQGQGFSGNREGQNRDPRDHYRPNRYDPTRHVRGRRGGQGNNGPRRPQSQQSQGSPSSAESAPQG